ncbi:AT-rich interactive domain-containing protein 3B-like [Heptranchias perlo]|uniref:AT-rich interactive domain-containing protein 3B-like n=1 Tax=Heptranchias perlo TaxID=212740 RepID=UPI00355A2F48
MQRPLLRKQTQQPFCASGVLKRSSYWESSVNYDQFKRPAAVQTETDLCTAILQHRQALPVMPNKGNHCEFEHLLISESSWDHLEQLSVHRTYLSYSKFEVKTENDLWLFVHVGHRGPSLILASVELDLSNGSLAWNDDADGVRAREAAKDFAKLYELDSDPKRKEFLDDLFVFMQKRGTPVNRIPIMAKQVLDLYMLYKLVTEKGGLVEVINKKIWREITKGLNLPTSITSAAFTLRTQYMKYLYPYECEKQSLSSPAELQAAIDSNRREGRRPSYSSALFGYSPSSVPTLLSPPRVHVTSMNVPATNGTHLSPGQVIKKEDAACSLTPSRIHAPSALAGQHSAAQSITLEQLREKLESGEPPEKRMAKFAEEQQRLMQQALQQNLFAMATHVPMSIKISGKDDRQELALNLSTNGISSINMSIEINGTLYTGVLFAQRPAVHPIAGPSSSTSASQSTPSPTSVKGPASAEPSTSGSP